MASQKKGNENIPIVLVGNKIDLVKNKSNLSEEAHTIAVENFKCPYIESSARYDVNIKKIFSKTFELILADNEDNADQSNRRNSSISIVRRLSLIHGNFNSVSRRFSLPTVGQNNLTINNKDNKKSYGKTNAKESGKNTPNSKRKQKNCSIS